MDENTLIGSGIVSEAIKNDISPSQGLSDVTNMAERNLLQGNGSKRNEQAQQVRGLDKIQRANVNFSRKSGERVGTGKSIEGNVLRATEGTPV